MTQSEALALPISHDKLAGSSEAALDLKAVHRMPFSRTRWFSGVSALTQAALMTGVGVFLFSQISATPKLAMQMTIVSSLLVAGGVLCSLTAVRDFLGFLSLDAKGYACRTGFKQFKGEWPQVRTWHVNEIAKTPEMACLEIATDSATHAIPGGMLDKTDLHKVRRLLCAFAEGKERSAT